MSIQFLSISAIIGVLTIQGGLFLAAAKSVFVTKKEFKELISTLNRTKEDCKSKLFDVHGIPIYVQKIEYDRDMNNFKNIIDSRVEKIFLVIEEIRKSQELTNLAISRLQVNRKSD